MKPGMLTSLLTALFVLSAVIALAAAGWYLVSLRQLRSTQEMLAAVNRNKVVVRSLIADALEYRKHNPAIDPVLQAARLLSPAVTATNSAPGIPAKK